MTDFTLEGFEEQNIIDITLPLKPGADFISRLLLQTTIIKNIIIDRVLDGNINGKMYESVPTDFNNNKRADLLYIPKEITLVTPPILIEIQKLIDVKFIKRIINYSLSICDKYNVEPVVVVIGVNGFGNKKYQNTNFTVVDDYYTTQCLNWAKKIELYTIDSIDVINQSPMKPFIALQKVYYVAKQLFESHAKNIEDIFSDTYDTYQKMDIVLNKISKRNEENNIKKSEKYIENALDFITKKRKKLLEEEDECTITSIESEETADFYFIRNFKQNDKGQMDWVGCFNAGQKENLFGRFSSHLKNAYNNGKL